MAEVDGKIEQPERAILVEVNYILDRGFGCITQAIQLVDEAVSCIAIPQATLEKVHLAITAAIQDNVGNQGAEGDIQLHITASDSHITDTPENRTIRTLDNEAHNTWGMFLVQHSESNLVGRIRQLIELRLYREIG